MLSANLYHIHLISDFTGETVKAIAKSALAQFNIQTIEYLWPLVKTKQQIKELTKEISPPNSIVLCTICDQNLIDYLLQYCKTINIPCISVLSHTIQILKYHLNQKSKQSSHHMLNNDYFQRMHAIEYTLSHDDGQKIENINEADIILTGISRTSKSPTGIYLAFRGYKVANIPFIIDIPLYKQLGNLTNKLIIGLTIEAPRLIKIRKNRLLNDGGYDIANNYFDEQNILFEIDQSIKFFEQNKWPIIDVTQKSIEETAAIIINYYRIHNEHI